MNKVFLSDCYQVLPQIKDNSIDLILIDPPYLISKKSNFKVVSDSAKPEMKVKYGSISIDFGDWDKEDLNWDFLFQHYYRILKNGGTLIVFYDIWKSSELKDAAMNFKFKQPRVCQWQKTNPVPINSKTNYLSNAIEYFFTFVKGSKPTFNSKYDNGVYRFPICHGFERTSHPTQKPSELIKSIVEKHSNPGDMILDTFAGSGTTGVVCQKIDRNFIMIEKEENYYQIILDRLNKNDIVEYIK